MRKFLIILCCIVSSVVFIGAEGASIDAKITSVSIWDVVVFNGDGFHRLHNVEVTIFKGDWVVSKLLTKTTDRGDLFMPFLITDLTTGKYSVSATDKINSAETSFELN